MIFSANGSRLIPQLRASTEWIQKVSENVAWRDRLSSDAFTRDLQLDLTGLRRNIRFLLQYPIAAIVPLGATGEFYSLTATEHLAVVKRYRRQGERARTGDCGNRSQPRDGDTADTAGSTAYG